MANQGHGRFLMKNDELFKNSVKFRNLKSSSVLFRLFHNFLNSGTYFIAILKNNGIGLGLIYFALYSLDSRINPTFNSIQISIPKKLVYNF